MYQKTSMVLIALWFLGFAADVGGEFIHLLFITAIVILILGMITRPTDSLKQNSLGK